MSVCFSSILNHTLSLPEDLVCPVPYETVRRRFFCFHCVGIGFTNGSNLGNGSNTSSTSAHPRTAFVCRFCQPARHEPPPMVGTIFLIAIRELLRDRDENHFIFFKKGNIIIQMVLFSTNLTDLTDEFLRFS